MSRPVVLDLDVDVTREDVYRYLGYPKGSRRSLQTETLLDEMWEGALALLHARGAYRVVDRPTAAAAGMPDAAREVGLAVCTIGPELEGVCAECVPQGRLLDALLLDAVGSAAADAAADSLNLALCTAADESGLYTTPRVSPGYGEWDVACQRELLALLPAGELGITLTSGCMMVPRKSVSFAVAFVERPPSGHRPGSACERCGLERCRHRGIPWRENPKETP
jgi:hypothetical protein